MKRIVNLVGAGGKDYGSDVPAWAVGPGFVSEIVETPIPSLLANEFDFHFNSMVYADTAIRAAKDGADAIVINTFGDYGLEQMRATIGVPVIGPGQTAMLNAAAIGKKFAIVTVWPPALRHIYERQLLMNRLEDRCVGVFFVTENSEMDALLAPGGQMQEMKAGRGSLMDRIEAKAKQAIAAGADSIVQGCTCMSPVRDEMQRRLPKPVLDPLVIAHQTAEMYVRLGIRHAEPVAPAATAATLRAMISGAASVPLPTGIGFSECEDGVCETLRTEVDA